MGTKIFTRGDAWMDPDYIVRLTSSIIGKRALDALAAELGGRDGHALRVFFWERIDKAVKGMSNETLGRICAYGGPRGFYVGPVHLASFLNMTGYKDVMNWTLDPSQKDGRGQIEELAVLTIVCVARDIIMQDQWQMDVARELDEEEMLDRAMRGYVHSSKPVVW